MKLTQLAQLLVTTCIVYYFLRNLDLSNFFYINATFQTIHFTIVAVIPCLLTQHMKMVDVAWPWGVVAISVLAFVYTEGFWLRKYVSCFVFFIVGLRMGMGVFFIPCKRKDFPRYDYAKLKFKEKGLNLNLNMATDIYLQAWANAVPVMFPLAVLASDKSPVNLMEVSCLLSWLTFFVFESTADYQKEKFRKTAKRTDVCKIGLWQYSRHPNYFGQWMQWNSIGLAAFISTCSQFYSGQHDIYSPSIGLIMMIVLSSSFYHCLVNWTGAKPAEYFSVKKRPGYAEYKKQVPMFFPNFFLTPKQN